MATLRADERFDVIVVGAGAAGGWAAKELTEQGLRVLLLEAGRSIRLEVDYPLPAPAESRLLSRVRYGLTRQPIQMRCAAFNARTRHFFVDDRDNPYTTPAGKPFNWFRGRQVGGRLHLWARLVCRLSDFELKAASHDGHGVDWPLSYADLAPYYERVERFLGVHGSVDGIANLPDCVYEGTHAMTSHELAFKRSVEGEFPERRVLAARLVKHDESRTPLTLRAAEQSGRLVLRSDAVVRRLEVDAASGKVTGVAFVDRLTKRPECARAEAVVLGAGTIETVRILLNSAAPRHPRGVGNSSGRLGTGLMDHLMIAAAGPSPRSDRGPHLEQDADPYDFARGTGFYVPRFRNVDRPYPGFLRGYAMQGGIGRDDGWFLLTHGEMLARPENRIRIDPDRRDAYGIPVASIECTQSSNELAMIEDAATAMREMAGAAGLKIRIPPSVRRVDALAFRLWKKRLLSDSGAFLPGSAIHELGGAAMGDDPTTSVVNAFGQCWDAPNVFVADGACFPSGFSQNATLTIMALAIRACDHLVENYRSGRFG
jgi:choline dehydrogenase-like flavoprotein